MRIIKWHISHYTWSWKRMDNKRIKNIVRESIRNVLNEESKLDFDVNIDNIPTEVLRKTYFDWRLIPSLSVYGKPIYQDITLKEAVGDTMPPDDVVRDMINKYHLPSSMAFKVEAYHKIYLYIIAALVGGNDKLVEQDMNKMGYFLAKKSEIMRRDGMEFQALQFEPTSQKSEDVTDIIKDQYKALYHWTPLYSVEDIMRGGLIPTHKNVFFNYPPRTYLIQGDATDEQRIFLGRVLCSYNKDERNDGRYALLFVNIENLEENIRFFYDPNSEIGIYTEQPISPDRVSLVEVDKLRGQK